MPQIFVLAGRGGEMGGGSHIITAQLRAEEKKIKYGLWRLDLSISSQENNLLISRTFVKARHIEIKVF